MRNLEKQKNISTDFNIFRDFIRTEEKQQILVFKFLCLFTIYIISHVINIEQCTQTQYKTLKLALDILEILAVFFNINHVFSVLYSDCIYCCIDFNISSSAMFCCLYLIL